MRDGLRFRFGVDLRISEFQGSGSSGSKFLIVFSYEMEDFLSRELVSEVRSVYSELVGTLIGYRCVLCVFLLNFI